MSTSLFLDCSSGSGGSSTPENAYEAGESMAMSEVTAGGSGDQPRNLPRSLQTGKLQAISQSQQSNLGMQSDVARIDTSAASNTALYQSATVTGDYNAAATRGQSQPEPQHQPALTEDVLAEIVRQLGPNQQIAVINGQVCIVNDDTVSEPQVGDQMVSEQSVQVQTQPTQDNFQVPHTPLQQNTPVTPTEIPALLSSLNSTNLQALLQNLGPQNVYDMIIQQIGTIQQNQPQEPSTHITSASGVQGPSNSMPYQDLNDDDVEIDGEGGNDNDSESSNGGSVKGNQVKSSKASKTKGPTTRTVRRNGNKLNKDSGS